ncbi:Fic family protein [Candidatus Uhrbacteria bacterium]|nr:Fic family protein [Candidatus Uhrbacteria bacterium]
MTIQQKLQFIIKLSGSTQEELARQLGVTFAAFNRWINGKAIPRPRAVEKIDELYLRYSGEKQIPESLLEVKKTFIAKRQKSNPHVIKTILSFPDIHDQFILSLTYHSNKIEGSTLSEDETADILFRNRTIKTKSVIEHLEAKNHQAALEYVFEYMSKKGVVDEAFIVRLHTILMNAIRHDAGMYRNHNVRILGTYVPTANHLKVAVLMKELIRDVQKRSSDYIHSIADIHSRFEKIHPFGDGNGRVGRLLMHAMALRSNLPPVVIRSEYKKLYMTYLNKSQMTEDLSLLEDFACDALLEGYGILERT